MRVQLYDRSGVALTSMADVLEGATGLSYDTAMPGGMTSAQCVLPWRGHTPHQKLNGAALVVRYDGQIAWWGRVVDDAIKVAHGAGALPIAAEGPWGQAARKPFTQIYPTNEDWSADKILPTAILCNLEDVAQRTDNWATTALRLSPISFDNTTIQEVIAQCLRIGDTTTSPWQVIIVPPSYYPAQTFTFSSTMATDPPGNFTAVVTNGATSDVRLHKGLYSRGGSSYKFVGGATNGQASVYKTISAATSYYLHGSYYLPRGAPAASHDLMAFYQADGTSIAILYITSDGVLTMYDDINKVAYASTGNVALGAGCWHRLSMRCTVESGGGGNGVLSCQLDGVSIGSQTGLSLGATQIGRVAVGLIRQVSAQRTLYVDNVVLHTAYSNVGASNITGEWLPEARIFKWDTSAYDIIISLAELGQATFTKSTRQTANILDVTYVASGVTSYVAPGIAWSMPNIGQFWASESVSRVNSATLVGYLRDRKIVQMGDEFGSLTQMTLTAPPVSSGGWPYPLPLVRAGLRFRIREWPELGNMYIGATHYTRGEPGQQESLGITPFGAPSNVPVAMARKVSRAWY